MAAWIDSGRWHPVPWCHGPRVGGHSERLMACSIASPYPCRGAAAAVFPLLVFSERVPATVSARRP